MRPLRVGRGLSLAGLLCLTLACHKTVSSIPTGHFVKANPMEVTQQHIIGTFQDGPKNLMLEYAFTDKEGDIDSIALIKIVLNREQGSMSTDNNSEQSSPRFVLPLFVKLPDIRNFPAKKGLLDFYFSFTELGNTSRPTTNIDDTVRFALLLLDAAGHKSDSIFSDKIVIKNVRGQRTIPNNTSP